MENPGAIGGTVEHGGGGASGTSAAGAVGDNRPHAPAPAPRRHHLFRLRGLEALLHAGAGPARDRRALARAAPFVEAGPRPARRFAGGAVLVRGRAAAAVVPRGARAAPPGVRGGGRRRREDASRVARREG